VLHSIGMFDRQNGTIARIILARTQAEPSIYKGKIFRRLQSLLQREKKSDMTVCLLKSSLNQNWKKVV
jgi:hypothetical protein